MQDLTPCPRMTPCPRDPLPATATRPTPRHQTLGTILKLDPNPGQTHRVLI